ncbi:MAG: hypothetical protein G01um101425_853 [Candidatus Peregrinibacteria bacterium Gr01-1014_25]|nr:MAG: hypothetical protein G01um101425_853 [Candidatus Peregrinibacteria bacterium Gr01-1014_25]
MMNLPTLREAFSALLRQRMDGGATRAQGMRDVYDKLRQGLSQWQEMLALVRDAVRDAIAARSPVFLASTESLDGAFGFQPLEPQWGPDVQDAAIESQAVDALQQQLAMLTGLAGAIRRIAQQADVEVPSELTGMLDAPFRCEQSPEKRREEKRSPLVASTRVVDVVKQRIEQVPEGKNIIAEKVQKRS